MAKAKHPHNADRPEPEAVRKALDKGDMEALGLALSARQRKFAEEYILDFNGTAAALRAGYAANFPDRQAHTLLKHKGVAAYIDHLTRSKEAKIQAVNPDWVIQKVTAIVTKDEARDGDKLRALELLARHLGMFIDRTEITGKDGEALEIHTKKIEEDAATFDHLLNGLRKRAEIDKEKMH